MDIMKDATLYVNGIGIEATDEALTNGIEDLFLKSTNDLKWLSPGDMVLLKPALNSPSPYPSTTHPLAIQVISKVLRENGAKVVVGDQSGIRSVLHQKTGVIRGNTRQNYIKSGMGTEEDNFIAFEQEGWNEGFYNYQSSRTHSWQNGFYLTKWIQKVDHVINLPRISTHTQAGATLGFKNMIGLLREDSRMEYHANGPYNTMIKFNARKSSLKSINDHSDTFMEKIVEISDSLRNKLRLTLFVATKAQTTLGPDRQILGAGRLKLGKAHVTEVKPGLIFASQDPVATETMALALLKYLRKSIPIKAQILERLILLASNNTIKLDKLPVSKNPYIRHSLAMELGEKPSKIEFNKVPHDIQNILTVILQE